MDASTKPSQQPRTTVGEHAKIDRRGRPRHPRPAINDGPAPGDWEGVDQWIARVLSRARQATDGPDNVRGILYVPQCFADELAPANPRFERQSFITAVTTSVPRSAP